ncbi:MFS transporter [Solicola gregarius]|uniref:MFS transporter n=1 Tax=Solicola gregarius TaxID=2908642 RepID=A0AA46TK10_9ACTN|nr:MFS transporter [Solicola gregarius]UYM06304.1 MFS transporter [Solicola gregarius]
MPAKTELLLATLALTTAIGALGLAAGGTTGALLGAALISGAGAGLPLGMLVAGSAVAALLISRRSARAGRPRSLALGYAVGALGALVSIAATTTHSVILLLLGSTFLGAANAAIFLTRYAAAELGGQHTSGRGLGTVLAAAALGAVASPNLLGPSGALMTALSLPRLAGLYAVALVAFGVAGLLLALAVPAVDRAIARPTSPVRRGGATLREIADALGTRDVRLALVLLAASNLIMVAVMTVAPVEMTAHGHTLTLIGVVISIHVAGMFAPSPVTGWLADHAGPTAVAAFGIVLLICTGIAGAITTVENAWATSAVLIALGVGWNCGVVGGSTMLASSVAPPLRTHVEGIGESVMGLAAALSAPLAGLALAVAGLTGVWAVTTMIAILVVAPIVRRWVVPRTSSPAQERTDQ